MNLLTLLFVTNNFTKNEKKTGPSFQLKTNYQISECHFVKKRTKKWSLC